MNITNQLIKIKSDVKNCYTSLKQTDAMLPVTENIFSLSISLETIPLANKILNLRSENGKNYAYLFHNYTGTILNLNGLNTTNTIFLENCFLNCLNLDVNSLNNIINWIPPYSKIKDVSSNSLTTIGLTSLQTQSIPQDILNIANDKGWGL